MSAGRVLVVDDDAVLRSLMVKLLTSRGYETLSASDGESALQAMSEWSPDLVLLDINMPTVNGFEVLQRRAAMPELAEIPVIVLSAQGDETSRVHGLELGALDFITKPCSSPELFARTSNMVRLRRAQIKLREANAELARLAATDPLTGLANRRSFDGRWEEECSRARRHGYVVSLVAFDIDLFKRVNDTHGHAIGDQVLCAVAGELERGLRAGDILARIGGEEFLLGLPHSPAAGAIDVAQRIRLSVASTPVLPDGGFCTVSAGIASTETVALEAIIESADAALYRAKANGRNRVEVFVPEVVGSPTAPA